MNASLTESMMWEFTRGDLDSTIFQDILYNDLSHEELFGHEFWLELISCNYNDKDQLYSIKTRLRTFLRETCPRPCRCIEYKNTEVIDMGDDEEWGFGLLERVLERGQPFWWLYLSKCRVCGQYWLVGQEERQNDVFILKRLSESTASMVLESGIWPRDFDTYEILLRIGGNSGRRVSFVDPDDSRSLQASIEELARVRPGIGLSEVTELLNLDRETAERLCQDSAKTSQIKIDMER